MRRRAHASAYLIDPATDAWFEQVTSSDR